MKSVQILLLVLSTISFGSIVDVGASESPTNTDTIILCDLSVSKDYSKDTLVQGVFRSAWTEEGFHLKTFDARKTDANRKMGDGKVIRIIQFLDGKISVFARYGYGTKGKPTEWIDYDLEINMPELQSEPGERVYKEQYSPAENGILRYKM